MKVLATVYLQYICVCVSARACVHVRRLCVRVCVVRMRGRVRRLCVCVRVCACVCIVRLRTFH